MKELIVPSPFINSFTCPACGSYSYHEDLPILSNRKDRNVYIFNRKNSERAFGHNYRLIFKSCHSCGHISIFKIEGMLGVDTFSPSRFYELIYPKQINIIDANPDMPDEVKEFYNEARVVAQNSTRAATALLRIATEKLVKDLLGLEGKDYANTSMHNAIERLKTEKGLSSTIYNALMALKLFGNEAAHPNEDIGRLESYFSNDSDLMNKLFILLNIIVDELISKPKEIKILFKNAPRK